MPRRFPTGGTIFYDVDDPGSGIKYSPLFWRLLGLYAQVLPEVFGRLSRVSGGPPSLADLQMAKSSKCAPSFFL